MHYMFMITSAHPIVINIRTEYIYHILAYAKLYRIGLQFEGPKTFSFSKQYIYNVTQTAKSLNGWVN